MITTLEIDKSSIEAIKQPIGSLLVGAKTPPIKFKIIGKWRRQKYQYLSRKRKQQYMKDWRAGLIQQREFLSVFGKPNSYDTGPLADLSDRQMLNVVRVSK